MIGAIAEAHCGQVPPHIAGRIPSFLPQELLGITVRFSRRYGIQSPGLAES